MVRDVGLAEELAQDALVAALEQWPETGVPRNPGAWLMTPPSGRAIHQSRRNDPSGRKLDELGREQQQFFEPDLDVVLDEEHIEDDILRLVFTACHPVLPTQARVRS